MQRRPSRRKVRSRIQRSELALARRNQSRPGLHREVRAWDYYCFFWRGSGVPPIDTGAPYSGRGRRHGWRGLRRAVRPVVIGSGLTGGRQSAGGVVRCWLVPRPIAPGCCRSNPEVSACSASGDVAPPRIRLILSRYRFAASKSKAAAAASIFRCRVSMVSRIQPKRTVTR